MGLHTTVVTLDATSQLRREAHAQVADVANLASVAGHVETTPCRHRCGSVDDPPNYYETFEPIHGHLMRFEQNSTEIADVLMDWLENMLAVES